MLLVDLREFARGPVETRAELAGDDPLFEGLGAALAGPVRVTGRLQAAGEARFYWRGSLDTIAAPEGRRCLRAVSGAAKAEIHARFTKDHAAVEAPGSDPWAPAA